MKPYSESIEEMDRKYRERTKGITMDERPKSGGRKKKDYNQGECRVPGCERQVESIGLCRYHRIRHYNGTLLRLSPSVFNLEEMFELYRDVFDFAENAGISFEEATAWLIAEGLNSFERRKL